MVVLLFMFFTLVVITNAVPDDYKKDNCPSYCEGDAYNCINGHCFCANGYVPNYYQTQCVRCPGLGESCYGPCCSSNMTLHCWHGVCQSCYGPHGNWVCREPVDQIILVSGTQIVMATALVLGIIATFVLLYKLCAATTIRPVGSSVNSSTDGSRLSVGSLQIYVDERLRDAPPRYTTTPPSGSSIYPAAIYLNSGFIHDNSLPPPLYTPEDVDVVAIEEIHDNSLPPPLYTPERKEETNQNGIVHM